MGKAPEGLVFENIQFVSPDKGVIKIYPGAQKRFHYSAPLDPKALYPNLPQLIAQGKIKSEDIPAPVLPELKRLEDEVGVSLTIVGRQAGAEEVALAQNHGALAIAITTEGVTRGSLEEFSARSLYILGILVTDHRRSLPDDIGIIQVEISDKHNQFHVSGSLRNTKTQTLSEKFSSAGVYIGGTTILGELPGTIERWFNMDDYTPAYLMGSANRGVLSNLRGAARLISKN